ncbi:hypothetical protein Tdes44962_MAKER08733 [Teratosphaeria destructans]|uniref:Uncharacterized protein n=1 Tax=Teratosphaeria destructans TaxID=418781 RepID=A0A9W7SVP4_9PEZI|nr:hypothetical protein Tdes44962_MAKER08733 [Teratosphaeria destructans]
MLDQLLGQRLVETWRVAAIFDASYHVQIAQGQRLEICQEDVVLGVEEGDAMVGREEGRGLRQAGDGGVRRGSQAGQHIR